MMGQTLNRTLSVAPMMAYTDRHCRYLLRLISRRALLYTEMVTTGALIHGDRERFLHHNPVERPLACQLGGSDPAELATCARLVEAAGYNEVNLNCGCPSDRVQTGHFGACLMKSPRRVADCVAAMRAACDIPVTVKHRIGVDDLDSYAHLRDFVGTVSESGCATFIVHARKAWLQGLSPKENRNVPPLLYERVYQLKTDFPHLEIILNGGVTNLEQAEAHLRLVDGVMLGREAYHNPWCLAEADRRLFGADTPPPERETVVRAFRDYAVHQVHQGVRLSHMSRHALGLFAGQPGGRRYRRYISEHAFRTEDAHDLFEGALAARGPVSKGEAA